MNAGILKFCNNVAALMRRPAVRRRLQSELAAQQQAALSYEELQAFFIDFGCRTALHLRMEGDTGASSADITTATRLAMELLPQLAPSNPCLHYSALAAAASTAHYISPGSRALAAAARTRYLTMLRAGFDVAQEQGSDYFRAVCGYRMASEVERWTAESNVQRGLPPPSAVLGWLQQAEAAHRRCKALLPKQWIIEVDNVKALAAPTKAWLQHLQQQGDLWRLLAPAAKLGLDAADKKYQVDSKEDFSGNNKLKCSGCGKCAPQLRVCGACREAQYCR